MKHTRFIIITLIVTALLLEIVLRITGLYITEFEEGGGAYRMKYGEKRPNWLHAYNPNEHLEISNPEFHYVVESNEIGHRERSFKGFRDDTSSVKVVVLGDSFTEGDGAPYDSSWVRGSEARLNEQFNKNVVLYNAGVCGSDVFFSSRFLTEKLIQAQPHLVIQAVSMSDMHDYIYRGGDGRFNDDGTVACKTDLWWEPLYARSHLFRAVVSKWYDKGLIPYDRFDELSDEAAMQIGLKLCDIASFCNSQKIPFLVVIHPVVYGDRSPDRADVRFENLMLSNDCEFDYINIRSSLNLDHSPELYWPINRHFNGLGYSKMGQIIADSVLVRYPDLFQSVQDSVYR